jgi:hypothetical protein
MSAKRFGLLLILMLGSLAFGPVLAGEDDVRLAFGQLQKAIKVRDPDKIWGLIDTDSQSDADRAGKAVQAAFGKADDKGKAEFEKKYGLSAKELADMSGKRFIKSNRFHGKYDEIPGSKLETIKVKADTARLTYIEEDGDKEKLSLVRQKGQWKFILPMPKAAD